MPTRRSYLSTIGIVAVSGVAGCMGSSLPEPETRCDCSVASQETVDSLPTPTLGGESAAVTVDIFEDYACPHCRDFHLNTLPRLLDEFQSGGGTTARFRFFDAPIPVSDWSRPVANAARFVQDAHGTNAFYTMASELFRYFGEQEGYDWQGIGDAATNPAPDVDPCGAISAGKNRRYKPVIDADRAVGFDDRGIPGTPAIFVDGEIIESPTYTVIRDAIESG